MWCNETMAYLSASEIDWYDDLGNFEQKVQNGIWCCLQYSGQLEYAESVV